MSDKLAWNNSSSIQTFFEKHWKVIAISCLVLVVLYLIYLNKQGKFDFSTINPFSDEINGTRESSSLETNLFMPDPTYLPIKSSSQHGFNIAKKDDVPIVPSPTNTKQYMNIDENEHINVESEDPYQNNEHIENELYQETISNQQEQQQGTFITYDKEPLGYMENDYFSF